MIFFPQKCKSVTYHYIKIEQFKNKHSRQCFKSPAEAFSDLHQEIANSRAIAKVKLYIEK